MDFFVVKRKLGGMNAYFYVKANFNESIIL